MRKIIFRAKRKDNEKDIKKTAKTMFNELGFKLNNSGENLLYEFETDYDAIWVIFDLDLRTYSVGSYRFIEKRDKDWVPMKDRPQNIKHSSRYGGWQIDNFYDISIALHNAIHQQMKELGWI